MWKEFTVILRTLLLTIPQTSFITSVVTYQILQPLKDVNLSSCLTLYTQLHSSVIPDLCMQVELFILIIFPFYSNLFVPYQLYF